MNTVIFFILKFLLPLNIEDILKNVGNQILTFIVLFYTVEVKYWDFTNTLRILGRKLFDYTHSTKYLQKKETPVQNNLRVSKR